MSLPSGLAEEVDAVEPIARFLTASGHANTSAVKPSAFLPNPKNGETSVFRHGSDPIGGLMNIASTALSSRAASVRGAAIIQAADVFEVQLDVIAKEPPPRHADIVGWDWQQADRDFGKAKQKEKAAFLAQRAGSPVRFTLNS